MARDRRWSVLATLATVLVAMAPLRRAAAGSHFITIADDGKHFALGGNDYYVHGFNAHVMMTHAASIDGREKVLGILEDAELHGFNVLRTWAFNDGYGRWNSLQLFPGIFDEKVFRALDYVLMRCREHKIRVLLTFINSWDEYGGVRQYVEWARNQTEGGSYEKIDFYQSLHCRELFKRTVSTILERRNVYTGVKYKNDPFIFGWDLINEPRAENPEALQSWTEEMANFVKSIDRNHLVTSGSEGFFGPSTPSLMAYNPGNWTNDHGVDYVRNHNISAIDFAVFHVYPDTWFDAQDCDMDCAMAFTSSYIQAHLDSPLKKPVVLEEVGKQGEGRDAYLEHVLFKIHENHIQGGFGAGTMIWQLSPANFSLDSFSITLSNDPTTGRIFKSFGVKVATRMVSMFQNAAAVMRSLRNRFWSRYVLPLWSGRVQAAAEAPSATTNHHTNQSHASDKSP